MIKTPAEIALMQAAADITVAAIREVHAAAARGHDPARHRAMIEAGDGRARRDQPVGAGAARRGDGLSARHRQAAGSARAAKSC